jgi:hypothetical protein
MAGETQPTITMFDDTLRSKIALLFFVQFLLIVGGALYIMHANWNVSTIASNLSLMVIQAELSSLTIVLSYYFGSSSGSAMKSMLMASQPSAVTVPTTVASATKVEVAPAPEKP